MKSNKLRLSFDITPNVKAHLELVQSKSNATTLTEVFRKSLALYELVLDQQAAKGKVILENHDGSREVLRLL